MDMIPLFMDLVMKKNLEKMWLEFLKKGLTRSRHSFLLELVVDIVWKDIKWIPDL